MAEEQKVMSESELKKEDWMNSKWRPMMGWMYMLVCTCDFVIFPVLWSVIQSIGHGQVNIQWQPITLQGAGLFHIAMGAVLGIAAFGRTQEKLGGANNGNVGSVYVPPAPINNNSTVQQNTQSSYYAPPVQQPTTTISIGYGGKPAPPPAYQPVI
jgi:hypothetical protein